VVARGPPASVIAHTRRDIMSTITHSGSNASVDCPPEARVTRALLGYGMLVGPVYLVAARGWAVFSLVTGVFFLAAFASIASGGSSTGLGVLAFTAAIVLAWAWVFLVSFRMYRRAAIPIT
jgi:hypothetical protein